MARSRRKRCMVYLTVEGDNFGPIDKRCDAKIKPGTPFCKEHFETHRIVTVKCNGEAHSNPFIDNCGVCLPHWGKYPIAIPKGYSLPENAVCEGGDVSEYD